jgi:hypothetical protein
VIGEPLRKHFDATVAKVSTEIILTGETPDASQVVT